MRHRKRRGKLKVSMAHHRAMRRNLVASLFEHGSITTTVAKAKAFQPMAAHRPPREEQRIEFLVPEDPGGKWPVAAYRV